MRYWLMKSEPSELGIDDLITRPGQTAPWFGVRNYQARNFMRDAMQLGDLAFFYHSGCAQPGIAGICAVASAAYPDATQFDSASPYFDARSSAESPRWLLVDMRFVQKTRFVPLSELRRHSELSAMPLLARGNRLSISPVSESEWQFISKNLIGE